MAHPDDIIRVGPLSARLGNVAAFLYLQEAEQPPAVLPPDPRLGRQSREVDSGELAAYEEALAEYDRVMESWWAPRETSERSISCDRVNVFLIGLGGLLQRLTEIHTIHEGMVRAGIQFTEERPPLWTEEVIQFEFYEAAKATFGTERADIREFFRLLYQLVTQTPNGPRWGQFVMIFGIENFLQMLQERFDNPFG